MNGFGVLTNRKRAIVALIHSFVFLGIAMHGFASTKAGVLVSSSRPDLALLGIYFVVASILAWLVTISRGMKERLYFALCASSATFGFLRTLLGDATIPAAQSLRVLMLTSAVITGISIVRSFSPTVSEDSLPQ